MIKHTTVNMVDEIHKSDLYCYIIEIGAGMGLTNRLFSRPDASKTVWKTECPYAKDAQRKFNSNARAVSNLRVNAMLDHMQRNCSDDVNTLIANSFQIGENKVQHGWVGVQGPDGRRSFYHFTLPEGVDRETAIQFIGDVQVKLLFWQAHPDYQKAYLIHCDGILDSDFNFDPLTFDVGPDRYTYICFDEGGNWARFEDLYRDRPINYYMGSFNPLHDGHKYIASHSENTAFVITTDNFDKPSLDRAEIMKRLEGLRGHRVIITKSKYFDTNMGLLRTRHAENNTVSMGYDTYIRCEDKLFEKHSDITFKVFDRLNTESQQSRENIVFIHENEFKEVSSTKIRNEDVSS